MGCALVKSKPSRSSHTISTPSGCCPCSGGAGQTPCRCNRESRCQPCRRGSRCCTRTPTRRTPRGTPRARPPSPCGWRRCTASFTSRWLYDTVAPSTSATPECTPSWSCPSRRRLDGGGADAGTPRWCCTWGHDHAAGLVPLLRALAVVGALEVVRGRLRAGEEVNFSDSTSTCGWCSPRTRQTPGWTRRARTPRGTSPALSTR